MSTPGSLSHIALVVRDAARTSEFLRSLFDAEIKPRADSAGRDEVHVRMGNTWFVLAQADVERPLLGDHIAFNVRADELPRYAERLRKLGRSYQMARQDTALYFTDYDNHVFELECVGLDAESRTD